MLPFAIELKPGVPVAEQIIYHAKKAIISGRLKPGDKFPSIRQLTLELGINHNTAQRVISALVAQGVLVTTPAVGSIVAEPSAGGKADVAELLGADLERVVVEARKLGLEFADVHKGLWAHWQRLGGK